MTLLTLFGSLFFNLSPCISVFVFFLRQKPSLILFSLTSAFVALVSSLLVAGVWALLPPSRSQWEIQLGLRTLSVILQGIGRYFLWRLKSSNTVSTTVIAENPFSKLNPIFSGLACGYGYGVFMVLLLQIPAWTETSVLLDTPHPSCPRFSSLLVSNIQLYFFFWHHLCWSILWFEALGAKKLWFNSLLLLSQLLVVNSTLSHSVHCAIPLSISSLCLIINFGLVYRWILILNAKSD